ncbi:MAG: hypothetical protein R2799_11015 [Crocinitomicaceae bacterium]
MKWIGIFLLALFILGCNKHSTTSFTVKGQIINSQTQVGVASDAIYIYENTSSGMNAGQTLIATGSSNSDGSYSIEFPRNLVESYTFRFYKEGYFLEEIQKNFDFFHTSSDNIINLNHRPIGWIRFIVQNTAPTDPQDQLKILKESGTENCSDCCQDGYYYFDGPNVDSTWICPNEAGTYFVFHFWDVLQPSYSKDSVLIQQNDTIDYVIQY